MEYNYGNNNVHHAVILTDPSRWGHWRLQLLTKPENPTLPYMGDVWVDEHPQRVNCDHLRYPTPDAGLRDGISRLPAIVKAMHPHERHENVPIALSREQLDRMFAGVRVAADWYGPAHGEPCRNPGCQDGDCRRASTWERIAAAIRLHADRAADGTPLTISYQDWLDACDALDAAGDWTFELLHEHTTSKTRKRCRACRRHSRAIRTWRSLESLVQQTIQGNPPTVTSPPEPTLV